MRKLIWIVATLMLISCGDAAGDDKKEPVDVDTQNTNNVNNAGDATDVTVASASTECGEDEARANYMGEEGCFARCDADAECQVGEYCHDAGLCVPGVQCTSDAECDGGFVCDFDSGLCAPNERTSCETRADCTAAAECKDGECVPHQYCSVADYDQLSTNRCRIDWYGCDDEKTYTLGCTDGACTCIVNDVELAQFEMTDACDLITHRVANEECGWSLPYAR